MQLRILILLALYGLSSTLACEDSPSYKFKTFNDGRLIKRRCSWLTERASKADFRTDKFCLMTSYGSTVADECRLSCDNCPTKQPTPTPVACNDSSTYIFYSQKYGYPKVRRCEWLTSKENKEAARVGKFCSQKHNGSLVKDKCPESCNVCTGERPAPTPAPFICNDSSTYTFNSYNNGVPKKRYCSFLTSNPKDAWYRVEKFCSQKHNGSLVKDKCSASCDSCTNGHPKPKPTPAPTPKPTPAPAPLACNDSSTYQFYSYKEDYRIMRKCSFLTSKLSEEANRIGKFCSQRHNGSLVRDECRNSCGNCNKK